MLEIGTHRVRNNVFLAPMAGITDSAFRELCAREGAGYAASEMISSDTLLHATAKTRHRVQRAEGGLPHAVQIAGSDPVMMADAAAFNVRQGADIIDINMGCPAKKVCNRAAGSALLEHPSVVRAILKSVVASVPVPVTLKIRTGPSPANRNGVAIARIASEEGIVCLAVHGRTRADRFRGAAEYDTIRDIKQSVDMPVIANGDIRCAQDAKRVLMMTGADGVMIGRAAQGDPWVFARVLAGLLGKAPPDEPSALQRYDTLMHHLEALYALYGEYRGVRIARKHVSWYCKGVPQSAAFRQHFNTVETITEQSHLVGRFFERPDEWRLTA